MKTKLYITKAKHIEKEIIYEFDLNQFYGKFYNHCNQVIYIGGHIKDGFIYWYEISSNEIKIEKNKKGSTDLQFEISKALKDYDFIKKISNEEFMEKVFYFTIN